MKYVASYVVTFVRTLFKVKTRLYNFFNDIQFHIKKEVASSFDNLPAKQKRSSALKKLYTNIDFNSVLFHSNTLHVVSLLIYLLQICDGNKNEKNMEC